MARCGWQAQAALITLEMRWGAGHDMELLTDMDRARLIAALGQCVLRAREIDPKRLELLLKLSDPDTRLCLHKRQQQTEICCQNSA